jgi:hypothetical protein
MTTLLDTEIKYDRITREYEVIVAGETVGWSSNYRDAEAIRTAALAGRGE